VPHTEKRYERPSGEALYNKRRRDMWQKRTTNVKVTVGKLTPYINRKVKMTH
jgi:hypothetical protein